MPDLYQHQVRKFADGGLQLRVPVDMVPDTQYSQLLNVVPIIEGRLETRGSLSWIAKVANTTSPGSGAHSLTRLNQPSAANVGDRVAGIDTTVQTFALPNGNVATARDTSRTGDPLSFAGFHYANDTSAWLVLSDRSGMFKYKNGVYAKLGLVAPPFAATAVDGGVGNLNNGAGPAYDWVYTYVNTSIQSESNPSPANIASVIQNPTVVVSPDPGFGGNAGTGVTATTATLTAQSATESRQSAIWSGFGASTPPFQAPVGVVMLVKMTFSGGTTGGCGYGAVYISMDGGATWRLALDSNSSVDFSTQPQPLAFVTPVTQDITKIQIRAVALAVGNTTVPQNVTARRIRERGGNYDLTGLLTGGGGNAQMVVAITNIQFFSPLVTTAVGTLALANRQATVTLNNPTDPQVDAVRLYRRGGSVTASWAFVQQFPVTAHDGSAFNVTDNVADVDLGGFVAFGNDVPVFSVFTQFLPLPYIWGPGFNPARLFGCGDPNRPDAVYFSNPGNADGWGVGQWIDVSNPSDPMQNGCVFNTRIFAFSKEKMFELLPGVLGGSTLTPFQTACTRGLISPWGLVANARAIAFVAKDGVYVTTGGEEVSLVEDSIKPIFPTLDMPGRQISFASGASIDAIDMERIEDIRLRFHNDELWFTYRGLVTGKLQLLIYDSVKKRWRAALYGGDGIGVITTVYSEEAGPKSSLLLGTTNGDIYTTTRGGADTGSNGSGTIPIVAQVQTGAYDQGMPLTHKEYGGIIFDIDPGGATLANPITITPLLNGEALTAFSLTVTGSGRQQIPLTFVNLLGQPLDIIGYNIEFFISWSVTGASAITPVLYQFDLIWRPEPTPLTRWEVRETSHGLPGWQHIRDLYVCLRSTADVTLSMTFDNNYSQSYTIPSTGGLRSKVYVPLNSNKFKLARYVFGSAQPFKIYVEDSEVRVKPWLTTLGYAVVKPFGAEATMTTAAFESQLLGGK